MDVLDYNGLAHFHAKEVDAYNRGYPDKAEYAFVSKRFKRVLDRFDGKNWTTDDEVTSSASVPVPTGAKMVDISTIGGASVKADVAKIVSKDSSNNALGTLTIPSAIRNLQGYGEANGTDINTVDFDSMTFHKKGYYSGNTWVADVQDIDISAYPVETMLPVEAGGSIEFEQEDDTTVAVPAALTFAVDLNDY